MYRKKKIHSLFKRVSQPSIQMECNCEYYIPKLSYAIPFKLDIAQRQLIITF